MDNSEREQFIHANVGDLLEQVMPGHSFTSVVINRYTHHEHGSYAELWPEPAEPGFETILLYVLFSALSAPRATNIFIADNGAWAPWEPPAQQKAARGFSLSADQLVALGKIIGARLLFYVVMTALAAFMGFGAPFLMAIVLLFSLGMMSLPGNNRAGMSPRRRGFNTFILGTFFLVALAVPGRALFQCLAGLSHSQFELGFFYYGPLAETVIGVGGLLTGILGLIMIWNINFRAMRQVFNLPTSTVSGASVGLVELAGVVRPGPRMGPDEPVIFWKDARGKDSGAFRKASSFYLEDATGRILVEPGGVPVSVSGFSAEYIGKSIQRIILTRVPSTSLYIKPEDLFLEEAYERKDIKAFFPGDPVYVIGYACERTHISTHAVGPDRLVVRPRIRMSELPTEGEDRSQDILSPFNYFNARNYLNVFIMSDTQDESVIRAFIFKSSMSELKASVFLVASAALLIVLVNL